MRYLSPSSLQFFLAQVRFPEGCWTWEGAVNAGGYGTTGTDLAHRQAWEYAFGPVPYDMEIDHLCGNKRCVCPAHLEPVSRAMHAKRTGAVLREQHLTCGKGHPWTRENTSWRERPGKGWARDCKQCNRDRAAASKARKKASSKAEPPAS